MALKVRVCSRFMLLTRLTRVLLSGRCGIGKIRRRVLLLICNNVLVNRFRLMLVSNSMRRLIGIVALLII